MLSKFKCGEIINSYDNKTEINNALENIFNNYSNFSNNAKRLMYSKNPTNIGAATDLIQVDDTFANALMNFALYRAYLKDAENEGNHQRAVNHYQLFAQSLAIGQESTIVNAPASEANVG